jgi:hypothetical protein
MKTKVVRSLKYGMVSSTLALLFVAAVAMIFQPEVLTNKEAINEIVNSITTAFN